MENERFDAMTQRFAGIGSRRKVLRALAAGALGAVLARAGLAEGSAQEATAAICLQEGKECRRANQCCSGVCKRERCRRPATQGTCTIQKDACRAGGLGLGPKCNSVESCECIVTAAGAAFCREIGGATCEGCSSDQDCVFQIGVGAKCIRARLDCRNTCGPDGPPAFCAAPCGFDFESLGRRGIAAEATPVAS